MRSAEYWVMRVVQSARDPISAEVARLVGTGDFALVNGEIVEPISCETDQEVAMVKAQGEHVRTGCVHKVVANLDVDV